jgi:4-hydroxyproline epimerase
MALNPGRSKPTKTIQVIDSHTCGEPTRVIIDGAPNLGTGSMAERRDIFRRDHDDFRATVVSESRGTDDIVAAILCEPTNSENATGVIFFNNVDCLWMCGHGVIGLVVTLAHMGRIGVGDHTIETPVGNVVATLHDDHTVSLRNVPSYRYRKNVAVDVPGLGLLHGDVVWGGNWFFLVNDHGLEIERANIPELTSHGWQVRQALERDGVTGANGSLIDHIEFFAPPSDDLSDSRNFVLCPGKAYDRSPCGTGTSAKLSCLAADGDLAPGAVWRQSGILQSVFEASYEWGEGDRIIPTIKGTAFVTAESVLIWHPQDPFFGGIQIV